MSIEKRLGYTIVSSFYLFILGVLYVFNFGSYFISVVLGVSLVILLSYFISFKKQRLDKTIYFSLLVFSTTLFLYFFALFNLSVVILFILAMTMGVYLNMLALNIYNVSERNEKPLPLLQAAKLVIFIALIIIVFLFSTVAYKINFNNLGAISNILIQLFIFIVFYSILFNSIIGWFFYEDKIGESKAKNILVSVDSLRTFGVLYLSQLSLVLMFTKLEDFGRGLFLAANMYILVNFIQIVIGRTLNRRFFIESLSVLSVIFLIIYYL